MEALIIYHLILLIFQTISHR